jgi:branched-chain amino acid transport system ATP-binding protein
MCSPRALLLDEPSLGLSPKMVSHVFEVLQRIRDGDVSILLVEQNLTHALGLADRGYIINRGQVALEGSAEMLSESDVFRNYMTAN